MADRTQTRVLRGGNIQRGTYSFLDNDIFIKNELVSSSIYLKKNDLITPAVTSLENIGKIARITEDYEYVTVGGFVFILRGFYNNDTLSKYLYYAMQSEYFISKLKYITKASGSAFFNINKERFLQLLIPIPTINEQSRIVSFLDEVFRFIDLIEKNQTDYVNLVETLKKAVLQTAIQGELVPQDENDEPASELLKRIRDEKKAQLGKKYVESYIYKGDDNRYYEHIGENDMDITEEIPFALPEQWEWSKLKYVAFTQTGSTPSTKDDKNFGNYIPFIKPGDINDFKVNYCNEGLSYKGLLSGRLIKKDSVLMVCIGGSLGKCAIIDRDVSCNQQINTATSNGSILPLFMFYVLNSDYFQRIALTGATGNATPILNKSSWENIFIPIPPFAEQERIVYKIDEIFAQL